jgi:glucose-6-phosphate isomerase
MIDLAETSGLAIEVTDDFKLILGPDVVQTGASYGRKFSEMQTVLAEPDAKHERDETYFVYRGLGLKSDQDKIAKNHLSYDLTVIPSMLIGKEYNKTEGHYHANIQGSGIAHPELYEVLAGKALFLLQKMDPEFKSLVTVLAIEGGVGDKIIYPPNYGHIIVNIGKETLVTANWLSTDEKSLYDPVKEKHGMSLYVVKGTDNEPTFIKNKNYKDDASLRKMDITAKIRTDFGLDTKEPMYMVGMKNPKILDFLNHPAKYAVELSALSS